MINGLNRVWKCIAHIQKSFIRDCNIMLDVGIYMSESNMG